MTDPRRLHGTWRLESYHGVTPDGGCLEGPLGPDPAGMLIYQPDGYVSVSMMRTGERRAGDQFFMGYAGTWSLAGHQVVHEVSVSSHEYLLGTRQVRDVRLTGDRLVLGGDVPPGAAGAGRRLLVWSRVVGPR